MLLRSPEFHSVSLEASLGRTCSDTTSDLLWRSDDDIKQTTKLRRRNTQSHQFVKNKATQDPLWSSASQELDLVHDPEERAILPTSERDEETENVKKATNKLSQGEEEEAANHVSHAVECQEVFVVRDKVSRKSEYKIVRQTAAIVKLLKACAAEKDLQRGKRLHANIRNQQLLCESVFVGSALISMYAKCGAMGKAQEVFDELPVRNNVLWNALISGYVQLGHHKEVLNFFKKMQIEGVSPDKVTFACILRACGGLGLLDKGQEIHAYIVAEHSLERDVLVGTALVDMYAKCGALEKAQEVFDKLPDRNVVSWTALISGYVQHRQGEEALSSFEQMQFSGISPNPVTFACILNACAIVGDLDKGQEIHDQILDEQLVGKDLMVANALIDMYAKCGALGKAQEVFDKLPIRDIVSWNALITGYAQHGNGEKALKYFELMRSSGFSPNAITLAGSLKACGSIGALEKGKEVHAVLLKENFFGNNPVLANALLDMYVKFGALGKAQKLLEDFPVRNVISWTTFIAGCAQHGLAQEALEHYEGLQLDGFVPDAIAFGCILKACGNLGAAYKGQEVHMQIVRCGFLENIMSLGMALVDMYANCGLLAEAHDLFDKLPSRDVVSWSVLMGGYGQLGKDNVVIKLFEHMVMTGTEPDFVTFTIILNVCSHQGLVEKGVKFFKSIVHCYHRIPTLDHHICMVDVLSRAGHLKESLTVVKEMPLVTNLTLWLTMLGSCGTRGSLKLREWVFRHIVELDENNNDALVSMSNVYGQCVDAA